MDTSGVTRRAIQAKPRPSFEALGDFVTRWSARRPDRRGRGGEGAGPGRLVFVFDFVGDGVDGVDLHGHGEFAHVAVVEDAAARRDLKGALLLALCALNVVGVVNELKPEEADGDGERPEKRRRKQMSQKRLCFMRAVRVAAPRMRAARGWIGLHDGGGCD